MAPNRPKSEPGMASILLDVKLHGNTAYAQIRRVNEGDIDRVAHSVSRKIIGNRETLIRKIREKIVWGVFMEKGPGVVMQVTEPKILTPDQAEEYYRFYLRGVNAQPEVFGRTIEDLQTMGIDAIQQEIRNRIIYGIFFTGQLVAMGALMKKQETFFTVPDIAELGSLYVDERFRRQGLATMLMEKRLTHVAEQMPEVTRLECCITKGNTISEHICRTHGFKVTRTKKQMRKFEGKEYHWRYWHKDLGTSDEDEKLEEIAEAVEKKEKKQASQGGKTTRRTRRLKKERDALDERENRVTTGPLQKKRTPRKKRVKKRKKTT